MTIRSISRQLLGAAAIIALTVGGACIDTGSDAAAVDSTARARTAPVVSSVRVNQGTYGMASRVKWMLSPDTTAVLVMVDPVGVENEPVANGFFYGSESRNFQARMDEVWDVAPSPDWQMIAFSKAYRLNTGEVDSIPPDILLNTARRMRMDTATVRNGVFLASGMAMLWALAQPGIIQVPKDPRAPGASEASAPRMYPIARGWRVRWTADGTIVGLGNNPARAADDEPSESWTALDARTGTLHGTLPAGAQLVTPQWLEGPALGTSAPVDIQGAPPINVRSGARTFNIESSRGVITARETTPGGAAPATPFTIGPGKALVATKGGRFIVALAPRASAVANEIPFEVVVYVVGW